MEKLNNHVSMADGLHLDHPHYVEKLARHVFRDNKPALAEVNRIFDTTPLLKELARPQRF